MAGDRALRSHGTPRFVVTATRTANFPTAITVRVRRTNGNRVARPPSTPLPPTHNLLLNSFFTRDRFPGHGIHSNGPPGRTTLTRGPSPSTGFFDGFRPNLLARARETFPNKTENRPDECLPNTNDFPYVSKCSGRDGQLRLLDDGRARVIRTSYSNSSTGRKYTYGSTGTERRRTLGVWKLRDFHVPARIFSNVNCRNIFRPNYVGVRLLCIRFETFVR